MDKSEKLAQRLADILVLALNKEQLNINDLAERFAVSTKTIRRDLLRLSSVLEQTQTRDMYQLVGSMQDTLLQKNIGKVIDELGFEKSIPLPKRQFIEHVIRDGKEEIFHFKKNNAESLTINPSYLKILEAAIIQKTNLEFVYKGIARLVSPYLIVFSNGSWYLAGTENGILKHFSLNKIKLLHSSNNQFEYDPEVKSRIKNTESVWTNNNFFEVILRVSEKVAHYFERKELLPYQEIIKSDSEGLLIRAKACDYLQIAPVIQYWVPDIEVVSPVGLNDFIKNNLSKFKGK